MYVMHTCFTQWRWESCYPPGFGGLIMSVLERLHERLLVCRGVGAGGVSSYPARAASTTVGAKWGQQRWRAWDDEDHDDDDDDDDDAVNCTPCYSSCHEDEDEDGEGGAKKHEEKEKSREDVRGWILNADMLLLNIYTYPYVRINMAICQCEWS